MPDATTTTNKPAWVTALDEAQAALKMAAAADTPEESDAKTRLAWGWMEIARMLKGEPAPST